MAVLALILVLAMAVALGIALAPIVAGVLPWVGIMMAAVIAIIVLIFVFVIALKIFVNATAPIYGFLERHFGDQRGGHIFVGSTLAIAAAAAWAVVGVADWYFGPIPHPQSLASNVAESAIAGPLVSALPIAAFAAPERGSGKRYPWTAATAYAAIAGVAVLIGWMSGLA